MNESNKQSNQQIRWDQLIESINQCIDQSFHPQTIDLNDKKGEPTAPIWQRACRIAPRSIAWRAVTQPRENQTAVHESMSSESYDTSSPVAGSR